MTTSTPLTEGNTRNIQKGNIVQPSSQPNVKPIAPPPPPVPPTQQNTNNGNSSGGG